MLKAIILTACIWINDGNFQVSSVEMPNMDQCRSAAQVVSSHIKNDPRIKGGFAICGTARAKPFIRA